MVYVYSLSLRMRNSGIVYNIVPCQLISRRNLLIACIYEILYDISHQHYYDTVRKENAWEEIAQTLKLQGTLKTER